MIKELVSHQFHPICQQRGKNPFEDQQPLYSTGTGLLRGLGSPKPYAVVRLRFIWFQGNLKDVHILKILLIIHRIGIPFPTTLRKLASSAPETWIRELSM